MTEAKGIFEKENHIFISKLSEICKTYD